LGGSLNTGREDDITMTRFSINRFGDIKHVTITFDLNTEIEIRIGVGIE
jgi:hypothetical protein